MAASPPPRALPSSSMLPTLPAAASPQAAPSPPRSRRLTVLQLFALLSVLIPLILTFIPLHSPVPVDRTNRACTVNAGELTDRHSHCMVGGACCPINEGMLGERSTRCSLNGDSCYEPVLGNWGLLGVGLLLSVLWCCAVCCCRQYVSDELSGTTEQTVANGRIENSGDALRYVRLSEVVEMR